LAPTNLVEVSPDGRLKLFDAVIAALDQVDIAKDPRRYYAIGLIAGFVATVAAGGAPSISLAAVAAQTHPTVLAWAYVVGGIGEKITWTSSFEGLGRLVVRELERPFHLDEGPLADFAYPEMKVLADRGLSDPLVHLKIKQARTVVVALSPGVNVVFPLNEQKERNGQQERSVSRALEASAKAIGDPMAVLVEALWPYLERKIDSVRKNTAASKAKGGKGRPLAARQEQDLPFEERAKNKR
jgi:hypothetical protein